MSCFFALPAGLLLLLLFLSILAGFSSGLTFFVNRTVRRKLIQNFLSLFAILSALPNPVFQFPGLLFKLLVRTMALLHHMFESFLTRLSGVFLLKRLF